MMETTERLEWILKQLIAIDTTNPPGNEKGIADFLQSLIHPEFCYELQHSEKRSSFIIEIPCASPGAQTLTFIGHLDTVPFSKENWICDPLQGTVVGNRMYGRGATDMKGGLACLVMLAENVQCQPDQIQKNLTIILTADEESGGLGMREALQHGYIRENDFLIVPEPTELRACFEEKGAFWGKLEVKGKASHGSMPEQGLNAIEALYRFVSRLSMAIQTENQRLGQTTVSINTIEGGNKVNIVADQCVGEIDIRFPPEIAEEDIWLAIDHQLEFFTKEGFEINWKLLNIRPALKNTREKLRNNLRYFMERQRIDYVEEGVRYYTDLSGYPKVHQHDFVILGPGIPEQCHTVDEYIELPRITECYELFKTLLVEEWPYE